MTEDRPPSATSTASLGRRFSATALDFVLVPIVTFVLVVVFGAVEHASDYVGNRILLQVLALGVLSYVLLNGFLLFTRGQTVGKRVFGLAVRNAGGGDLAFWRLVVRALFFPLLYLFLVPPLFVLPLIDLAFLFRKDRRCLHDIVCGTVVQGASHP